MNCPDTCVISNEGNYPSELCSETKVKRARKATKCCECREVIPVGASYEKIAGKWDGTFSTFRTCALCEEIRGYFSCDGGWQFEQVWEDLAEYIFAELTIACLDGNDDKPALSPAAKAKVLARWRKWKGLA